MTLHDPSVFKDKQLYWRNQGTIASEISRSNDVFIEHNFNHHEGAIPLWASVEVMSFGTISKTIKNMKTGNNSAISTRPQLISSDVINPQPRYNGLYQIMLSMKYLRPTEESWTVFVNDFKQLLNKYAGAYDIRRLNFPSDWESHF